MTFTEYLLGGTYLTHNQLAVGDDKWSDLSPTVYYSVDTSAPVQTKKGDSVPEFTNSSTLRYVVPEFVDDSRDVVSIQNVEGGLIDGNATGWVNQDTGVVVGVTATATPTTNATSAQQWVIKSNGQIRAMADGGEC